MPDAGGEETREGLWVAVAMVGLGLTGFAIWITTGVFALFPSFLAMGVVVGLALAGRAGPGSGND